MTIKVTSEKAFVYSYVQLLQGRYGFTDRETEVASAMVLKLTVLTRAKTKLKVAKTREAYDPMLELKKPEVLAQVVGTLNMDFTVFRTYISKLKTKGFFNGGGINTDFVPDSGTANIKIDYDGYRK